MSDSDEFTLDLEALDTPTLTALAKYVVKATKGYLLQQPGPMAALTALNIPPAQASAPGHSAPAPSAAPVPAPVLASEGPDSPRYATFG